ncbi:hypothetical protein GF345_03140 [Candidatus Woesearchaeota archaeon]|nr:hypothetical protein [Candidatus Woesearchaeota archaeon]
MTIGREIEKKVLKILEKSDRPVSTRDLALRIERSWHSVQHHCFRLQIAGKIDGFRVGRMNLWVIKKQDSEESNEDNAEDNNPLNHTADDSMQKKSRPRMTEKARKNKKSEGEIPAGYY